MGLRLLDREGRVLKNIADPKPSFEGYEYLLRRQLSPEVPMSLNQLLADAGVKPTSMIDLSDGLASDLLQVCRASGVGAKVFLDRLPIASETFKMAEELNTDPVIAVMNGGEDYEMMFTISLEDRDKVLGLGGIEQIGYIVAEDRGVNLTTPDGEMIAVTAPGFK
jgi:thiamine-monophosphate kinase